MGPATSSSSPTRSCARLEHAILERLAELDAKHQVLFAESKINIENFYGIEIDDFAVEVAILSLWIAKHQMNAEFKEKFNLSIPLIPLKETGQIQQGNATRVDWNAVCPNDGGGDLPDREPAVRGRQDADEGAEGGLRHSSSGDARTRRTSTTSRSGSSRVPTTSKARELSSRS